DGWKEADIDIPVPCVGHKQKEADAPVFTVKGLLYRDLVQVITEQLKDPETFKEMYLQPFSEHWKPTGDDTPVRVYGEVYSSDAMLDAQHGLFEKLQDVPRPRPEAFLVALMLASDSTFLTQFSQASMWPVYMFFGNTSKYTRCSPSSLSTHHVAYLPKIDEQFSDFYVKTYHQVPSPDVLAFVKRELVHRVLRLMFGGKFSEAHTHGIITECADRIARLWFPWLVCHETDYPERSLVATIRFLADFPCPHCLVLKSQIGNLSSVDDMECRARVRKYPATSVKRARKRIFEKGGSVNYRGVEDELTDTGSWVPTENGYYLSLGIEPFELLVVDILHDFEIGVFKMVFTHLIRILYSVGPEKVQELNRRCV
ncbi:hypothetical protein BJ322DRAFT_1175294, partial [Thelephora terrestris]